MSDSRKQGQQGKRRLSRFSDKKERGTADVLSAEPRFLILGRVTRPHGVRGEFRVTVFANNPERFKKLRSILLTSDENDPEPQAYRLKTSRTHGDLAILRVEGINHREAVDPIRRWWVMIPIELAVPLAEGEYYLYQLFGLKVVTEEKVELGILSDVLETGANNVFVIRGEKGELLIPDTPEVVVNIDFEQRQMTIRPIPGLLPA